MWKCKKCETLNNNEHYSCYICYNVKVTTLKDPPPWWKRFLLVALAVATIFVLGFVSANLFFDSSESEMITMPDVVGLSLEEARELLEELGLDIHTRDEYDSSIVQGVVISQNIEDGVRVEPGTRIQLMISRGPEMVTVPSLVGLSLADARQSLEGMGLRIHTRDEYDTEIAEGVVISQDIEDGAKVEPGTRVELMISRGPEPEPEPEIVAVSNVMGLTEENARQRMRRDGFLVNVSEGYHPTTPRGLVINQTPNAGSMEEQGTRVNLVISRGPDPNQLPFVYDVGGFGRTQITSGDVTINVPIPLWDVKAERGDSYRFFRGFQWSAVGAIIGRHDSIEEATRHELQYWPSLPTTESYEFTVNTVLEGTRLLVLERERVLGENEELNEDYFLLRSEGSVRSYVSIFEYRGQVVYVILHFDGSSTREQRVQLLEVYGFGKFIEAGIL